MVQAKQRRQIKGEIKKIPQSPGRIEKKVEARVGPNPKCRV